MPKTEMRFEVEIAAPAAHVYRVLTDFASYEQWNPFLTSVRGTLAVGQKLKLEMSLPEGRIYELEPEVTQVTENVELRWRGRFLLPALLEAEHFFQLQARSPTSTLLVQGQNFSGFLLRFAGNALTLSARGSVYMNQALKKRAESTAALR
ncbi:MAG: SRPBCC domain-containing protein [Myxococcales bacterium]